MASAKQIAWRKKFAKMAKSGKFKKAKRTSRTVKTGKMKGWDVEITGTSYAKKSKPEKKNSSRAKLEQRIADLEEKFHQKLKHYQDYDSRELDFEGDQIRKTRIKLSDELKREMRY